MPTITRKQPSADGTRAQGAAETTSIYTDNRTKEEIRRYVGRRAFGLKTIDGPVAEVTAMKEVSMSISFQSVKSACSVRLPVVATPEGVAAGFVEAWAICDEELEAQARSMKLTIDAFVEARHRAERG